MNRQFLLLILPICFVCFSIQLRNIEGPYYDGFADPSYIYLFNSLNLIQGFNIGHVDHPGTPVQEIGAIVIKVFHTLNPQKINIIEDVLYRPETYLIAIDFTFVFLNFLGLLLTGLIIYSVKKNLFVSLLFQTIPFISINILDSFTYVKPENFVFFLVIILISLSIKFAYRENLSFKKSNFYIIGFGMLCGLILAAKISFLCLVLLPLMLIPRIWKKILFSIITFFSFLLFVLPAISNISYFVNWAGSLFIYNERYGKGNPTIINLSSFFTNISKIIVNEKLFFIGFLLIIVVFIWSIFWRKKEDINQSSGSRELKLLAAFFLAMCFQLILVAKHYSSRYMYPALILTIPTLFIVISILYKRYFPKINSNIIYGSILSLILLLSFYNSVKLINKSITVRNETNKLKNYINTNHANSELIFSSDTSNEFVALLLAYYYSGESGQRNYKTYINQRFPDKLIFEIWDNTFHSASDSFDIKNIFKSDKKIIFQTKNDNLNNNFIESLEKISGVKNIQLSKVFSNDFGESIYELDFEKEKNQ